MMKNKNRQSNLETVEGGLWPYVSFSAAAPTTRMTWIYFLRFVVSLGLPRGKRQYRGNTENVENWRKLLKESTVKLRVRRQEGNKRRVPLLFRLECNWVKSVRRFGIKLRKLRVLPREFLFREKNPLKSQ